MNLFNNKYPYTDFHELNLDWLLEKYQDLVNQLNTINSWISTHQIEYEDAIERLQRVENELYTFEDQINAAFDQLRTQQQAQLDNAIASINLEVDTKLRQLEDEVNTAVNAMQAQIDQLLLEVNNEITQLISRVNREIIQIRNEMRANNQLVFEWVENRIQELIDSLPEILTVYVYNPYRGETTDIQTAILDIYSIACIWGLTAFQYDSLGLTAEEYDNLELTARDYDTMGYKLLYPDPNYYMFSPFTGTQVHIKEVVTKLCYFHMEGLTAEEYDNLELTAEEYDAKNIDAFNYDWFGEQILTA